MRVGAVNYLNSKPLIYGLDQASSNVRLLYDLPSRLADSLAAGRLDVALIPSVEFFRLPGGVIVSDACVASRGPVLSVKLHFRVSPDEVRRVALDEGSRTSAALAQVLLAELSGVTPQWESLPIGCGMDDTDADAVLLIGDRAMQSSTGTFVEVWDLGERWFHWSGLPMVFARWVGRGGADGGRLAETLTEARDRGIEHVDEIAAAEAPLLGIDARLARDYLCDNLHYRLGPSERAGLTRFHQLCVERELVPAGIDLNLESCFADGSAAS